MRSVRPDSEDSWERRIAKQVHYDEIERQGMTEEERRKFREKPICLQMLEAEKRGELWKGPIRRDSKFYVPPGQKKKPKEDINPMDILLEQSEAAKSRSEKADGSRLKKRGRPKGSKDSKPRKRRTQAELKRCEECEHLMTRGCELSKCHFRKVREE